ncbi:MAG TPA: o-succinylbenzoate synthase [Acidimicrobiia bacterium]
MRIDAVELRRVCLPLVTPFRTSFGTDDVRDALLVHVLLDDGGEGWGECVADLEPLYSSEHVDGAAETLRRFLIPRLLAWQREHEGTQPEHVASALDRVQGHPMAKGALEMAVLDASLRSAGRSFGERLGAVRARVDCGVSVGIQPSVVDLLDTVAGYLDDGYRRVKLKIEPEHDVEPVRAVRARFPDVMLQVDANAAYSLRDDHVAALRALDDFDLALVEQPLAPDDLLGHATLAGRVRTPICLDESITSARVAELAITIGACSIVNIKAGRVGGYLEAVRVHDACATLDTPAWCGGMLETGLGRAANIALAALPNFTLPGDTSASARYFAEDLTEPFVLDDGRLAVPTGPGLGVAPRPEALRAFTTAVELIRDH